LVALQSGNLESLLDKAKELENKYEWLQAIERYEKALELVPVKDILTTADLNKKIGFCYYRAAFQAQTNAEFKELLKHSIQAYEKEMNNLAVTEEDKKEPRIKHTEALVVYIRSWIEMSAPKRKALLNEWWTLENQVLEAYERSGDVHSAGIICTEMIEFSHYTQVFLTDYSEGVRLEEETVRLIDKAIQFLSKSDDNYELARAYCFASIRLSWGFTSVESVEKRLQDSQIAQDYSKKALKIAQKIGADRLIGCSYISLMNISGAHVDNHKLALEYGKKIQKYGRITKDKFLTSYAMGVSASVIERSVAFMEDPDNKRESLKRARKLAQKCRHQSKIINHAAGVTNGFLKEISTLMRLVEIETDPKNKQEMLEKAIKIHQEGFGFLKEWKRFSGNFYPPLSASLVLLAETKSDVEEKKALLLEAQSYSKKFIFHHKELWPYLYGGRGLAYYNLGKVQHEIAKIENKKGEKIEFLQKAFVSLERSNELNAKSYLIYLNSSFAKGVLWKHNYKLGEIAQHLYSITKEDKTLSKAIEAFKTAAEASEKAELPLHLAESNWHIALLLNQQGKHQEASQRYETASSAYDVAANKVPQLKEFYENYSIYLRAWSQISQARHAHSLEKYAKAKKFYNTAAELHESSEFWSYLAPNYIAWVSVEEAESLSRQENSQEAKDTFQKALRQFNIAKQSIKKKLEERISADEKELNLRLLKASDLRSRYCQARVLLENAKMLDRQGEFLQSSKSYGMVVGDIGKIIDELESEEEKKELRLITIIIQAWEKMALAEGKKSPKYFMEAAALFEKAKDLSTSEKKSLWALGNSSFCKGFAAGIKYQTSADLKEHAKAKGLIKSAATSYFQAGYKAASEYAKATQRLFDAYLFMNRAEMEADQEKRAKQYQMAENLLKIAASSFMKAKQPEKTVQVQQILENVREEKALAVSLSQVMQAPIIASTTSSFTAPTTSTESSVGLENFEHANVQANLITHIKEVKVGESFCLSVEFVNAGREPALLMRVDDFVPSDFVVVKKPEIYRIEESCLNMKGKQLAPLKLVEVKLTVQPSKKGNYKLNPRVHYLDELGQNKSLQLKTLEIKVEEVILEDRVSTGTQELDSLLLGGIPGEYAVILTGSPSDERERLIQNFLEAGIKDYEIVFDISTEADGLEYLLEKSNFHLFLCNPKPKTQVPDLSNIYKLRSKTDLTNLSISLAKTYRTIDQSKKKRICIETVSDVLVDYETKATRKWISELITDLGSKGFTMLAVINPDIHPHDQARAIIDLFDGEISLTQTEDPLECRKSVRVKKLRNQDYIKNPICLT
jgi:KaiC/GvpD/RAD55 family RecA-like ATPase